MQKKEWKELKKNNNKKKARRKHFWMVSRGFQTKAAEPLWLKLFFSFLSLSRCEDTDREQGKTNQNNKQDSGFVKKKKKKYNKNNKLQLSEEPPTSISTPLDQ